MDKKIKNEMETRITYGFRACELYLKLLRGVIWGITDFRVYGLNSLEGVM